MTIYTNLDGTTPDKNLGDILKWQIVDRLTGKRRRSATRSKLAHSERWKNLAGSAPRLTWIGHASFVLRLGGKLIATDPIWSNRIQGAVPRLVPPGVAFENVPKLDIVTVSHAHFDHLDLASLKMIGKDALYIVPKDNGDILRGAGLTNVRELAWWESHTEGDLKDHARAVAALVDAHAVGPKQAPVGWLSLREQRRRRVPRRRHRDER